jgi:general secretion pathway protein L
VAHVPVAPPFRLAVLPDRSSAVLFISPGHTSPRNATSTDGHWAAVRPTRDGADQGRGLPDPNTWGTACILVLPAHAVSWHAVTLPKSAPGKWRAALEGLLEERLLDDPSQLHFALPSGFKPQPNAAPTWVAVCDRGWLKASLQSLSDTGWTVTRIVPETTPLTQPTVWAHEAAGEPWLTWMAPQGVVHWPIENAATAQPGLSSEQAARRVPLPWQSATEMGYCCATPAAVQMAEACVDGVNWQIEPVWKQWLRAADTDWDLAQFDIRLSAGARREKSLRDAWQSIVHGPAWRPFRRGLVALVAVHLVGLNAVAWQQQQALAALNQSVRDTLTQTFPQVTLVLDAPRQMEREMERMRASHSALSNADLEPLLQVWAPLAERHGVELLRIDFEAQRVTLAHTPWPPEGNEALKATLRSRGWQIEVSGGTTTLNREGRP